MRAIKSTLLLIFIIGAATVGFAQDDPVGWSYELKKKSGNEYQAIYHLTLEPGWHVWSLKPGGDGYEIAPSFAYDNNANVKLKGKLTEKGKMTNTTMQGIDGIVHYLTGKIDYVQDLEIKGNTRITGKYTYQVCTEKMCLPPKDKDFVFEVK
jgi:thiol:disulfide interchange protein DsbD